MAEPESLAEAVVRAPQGFDMRRRDDIVSPGVAEIILRQVVAPQWREVADASEPRVTPEFQVPEMVMRIDDRTVLEYRRWVRLLVRAAPVRRSRKP